MKCTTIYNGRAQLLFCSLNLLLGDVLVAVVCPVKLPVTGFYELHEDTHCVTNIEDIEDKCVRAKCALNWGTFSKLKKKKLKNLMGAKCYQTPLKWLSLTDGM